MTNLRERVLQRTLAAADPVVDEDQDDIGELEIAEYIVFLLALDTYTRYVEETAGQGMEDDLIKKGVQLVRLADRKHLPIIQAFLDGNLPTPVHKKMLDKAFRFVPTTVGLGRRSLQMRTLLSRGGTSTMRAVFKTNKALQEVKAAMAASMVEDADAALDKFAVIPLRNARLRKWIDVAAETAGSGTYQNAVAVGSNEATDDVSPLFTARAQEKAAPAASEQSGEASAKKEEILLQVQQKAQDAAQRAMAVSGEPDVPPNKSEVIGIATAAAVAAVTDPSKSTNVPASLKSLDEEQIAAALTDGKVLVAAGAGAGKSTTLVARIDYLVKERGANPSRILACSFNKKAADELKSKIAKKLGYDASSSSGVQVGTMHSLFYKFIVGDRQVPGFGTREEQDMLRPPRLIAPPKRGVKSVSPTSLSTAIRSIWINCGPEPLAKRFGYPVEWLKEPPKAKKANLILNKWRGNDVTLEQAKTSAKSKAEAQAVVWYEFYMGVKGDIPGWRPPCISSAYDNFMNRNRKGGERLGDLDDMLKVFLNILRRDEKARSMVQGMFDHFLVDECVHESTQVMLEGANTTTIGAVQPGVSVLCYFNGQPTFKRVLDKKLSRHRTGLKIITAQGFELDMTPEHRLYATSPQVASEGNAYLYLMYRQDLGFRLGVSERPTRRTVGGSISRASAERADALWIVAEGDRSEMLYLEQSYSLEYGIPTCVFEGTVRGLDQSRINRVFDKYGQNGLKLLEAKNLDLKYPNWMNTTCSTDRVGRLTINLTAHRGGSGSVGTSVGCSWTGERPELGLEYVYRVKGGRNMFNRRLTSYVEAKRVALELAAKSGGRLRESVSIQGEDCYLVTASALFPGMCVPVITLDGVTLDRIESIVESTGVYYDIAVEDAANFFGNGVLSHNCQDLNLVQHQIFELMTEHVGDGEEDGKSLWMIGDDKQAIYQFRGARPELFTSLDGKQGWKTRMIRTNYRCEAEIVEAANKLVAHNNGNIPMEARANPKKDRGKASIIVDMPPDNTIAAIDTIGRIVKDIAMNDAKAEDYAVLARTNAELNDFETACIINEIPYVRRGGKGFLEAPETKAVLGYLDLATGNDYEKMKDSLVSVLMKPDRNLFLGYEDVTRAVEEAIDDVARRERVDKRSVSPTILFQSRNIGVLADKLKQPYRLKIIDSARGDYRKGEWMYKKRVEELEENLRELTDSVADIRDFVQKEGTTTSDLLNHILDIGSTVAGWDPVKRQATKTTTTLREQITHDRAIFSDDDDGDEEEVEAQAPEIGAEGELGVEKKDAPDQGKGLGAIQFLYQMAEPNPNDQANNTDPSTASGFVSKLARYAKLSESLRIDPDKWEREQGKLDPSQRRSKPPAISLSTVHSVKGLEWPNVTVLMPKGKFPLERKAKPDDPPPDPVEDAERMKAERNLAYVALTRAAVNLEVVCPESNGISPFVFEAGLRLGENVPKDDPNAGVEKTAEVEEVDPYVAETIEKFAEALSGQPLDVISYDRRES